MRAFLFEISLAIGQSNFAPIRLHGGYRWDSIVKSHWTQCRSVLPTLNLAIVQVSVELNHDIYSSMDNLLDYLLSYLSYKRRVNKAAEKVACDRSPCLLYYVVMVKTMHMKLRGKRYHQKRKTRIPKHYNTEPIIIVIFFSLKPSST